MVHQSMIRNEDMDKAIHRDFSIIVHKGTLQGSSKIMLKFDVEYVITVINFIRSILYVMHFFASTIYGCGTFNVKVYLKPIIGDLSAC